MRWGSPSRKKAISKKFTQEVILFCNFKPNIKIFLGMQIWEYYINPSFIWILKIVEEQNEEEMLTKAVFYDL